MIRVTLHIEDFSYGVDIDERFEIGNATYVPMIGEHISLTRAQEPVIVERIYKSSYLKKAHMKYVMKQGRKPLKLKEYKDLTPAQIRKKIDNHEWYIFLPPTLKIVGKSIRLAHDITWISLNVEFSDKFYQDLES